MGPRAQARGVGRGWKDRGKGTCMIQCLLVASREPRKPHIISNLSGTHQARPLQDEAASEVCK